MARWIASNASSELKLTSLKKGTASHVVITAGAAATTLGLTAGTYDGSGDAANIALTTTAELQAKIDSSARKITESADGYLRLSSTVGGSGTVQITDGTANSVLGFTEAATATAADLAADAVIPAGTRLSDGGADSTRVVTMQTTTIAAGAVGVTLLKVRPAIDDGTYAGAAIAAIDTLEDDAGDLEWSIGNPVALGDALTPSEIDALYLTAMRRRWASAPTSPSASTASSRLVSRAPSGARSRPTRWTPRRTGTTAGGPSSARPTARAPPQPSPARRPAWGVPGRGGGLLRRRGRLLPAGDDRTAGTPPTG